MQQQAPVNSFEHHLEALRRAMVVREILLGKTQDASLPLIIYIYICAEVFSLEKLFVGRQIGSDSFEQKFGFC